MGYMGLSSWGESDEAADLRSNALRAFAKVLEKNVNETTNCYNTDGAENVAMILEDGMFAKMQAYEKEAYFGKVATEAKSILEKKILKAKDSTEAGVISHANSYKRMVKSLNKFISRESVNE